jgi:uracil-DNA glycosylase family 4
LSAPLPPEAPRDCPLCPRLAAFREANKTTLPAYFNGAVPSFGASDAELLIVGLAPGLHGANKTGRPFTGDYAGDLLYATLLKTGLAEGSYEARPDDGVVLKNVRITNAVRCVPPENKPTPSEIKQIRDGESLENIEKERVTKFMGSVYKTFKNKSFIFFFC